MAPRGNPPGPGYSWCDNCGKWKADEAFVRSSVKRGSKQWKLQGFKWKRYRTCNRCSRVYFRKGMSLADFIKYWGAEEHNNCKPNDDQNGKRDGDDEGGGDEGGMGSGAAVTAV